MITEFHMIKPGKLNDSSFSYPVILLNDKLFRVVPCFLSAVVGSLLLPDFFSGRDFDYVIFKRFKPYCPNFLDHQGEEVFVSSRYNEYKIESVKNLIATCSDMRVNSIFGHEMFFYLLKEIEK